ncbi:MAG TPA: OmpH family outer membrane protein [Bryobacteraceae bacterium]|nr:OmpH family outer membrane protein [Bryobacteraceae bacterium]
MFTRIGVLLLASLGIAAAQSKVAIINVQNAVLETAELKKAQADLEAKFKPRQAQIDNIQKELAGIQAQLQSGGGKLTQQQAENLQATGQRRQRELQRLTEDVQADVDRERNEVLQRAGSRMQEVVRKLADERGVDVVIDVSNAVYFRPALDITKDAIAAYDKAHPVPPTTAAAK